MKLNNIFQKGRSPYNTNKTRVRKSYYTFSREYPAGNIPFERRSHLKLKSDSSKKILTALMIFLLLGASFFFVRLSLDISHKAPDKEATENITVDPENTPESLLVSEGFRALYMPYEKLGDASYIKTFIKKVRRYDCNSVIIDFKTESGKLCYSSMNSYAIKGKCAIYDNNTVREALNLFKKENVTVAARIYCFLDNTVPQTSPELAVKYMDTDVNWIDTASDGKTWLNPCEPQTLSYLLDIVSELQAFGIKGFILENCHFPDSKNTGGASFPGEKNFKNKNIVLRAYIQKIKEHITADSFLIITQSADDALNGNKRIYYGSISTAEFDGVAAYTSQRPDNFILDKKTDFVDMMGLFSSISQNYVDRIFMPIIDLEEHSGKYMRTIRKNGYTSYIIIDPEGEY